MLTCHLLTDSSANKPLTNDQETGFYARNLASDAKIHGIFASHGEPSRRLQVADLLFRVGVAGHYSNRPDLLEQLREVAAILSNDGQDDGTGAEVASERLVRSRRLRDRFSLDNLQAMIDLYRSGTTARQVAEKFGVSLRSVKRLLRQHGVRREQRSRGPQQLQTRSRK